MLAEDQPALRVEQQAVGARLAARGARAGVAAGLEEDADPFAFLPAEDRVLRHVGEEQVAAVRTQTGPSDQPCPRPSFPAGAVGTRTSNRGSSRVMIGSPRRAGVRVGEAAAVVEGDITHATSTIWRVHIFMTVLP